MCVCVPTVLAQNEGPGHGLPHCSGRAEGGQLGFSETVSFELATEARSWEDSGGREPALLALPVSAFGLGQERAVDGIGAAWWAWW